MTSSSADSFPEWDGEEPYSDAALAEAVARLENGEPLTAADEAALARLGAGAEDDDRTCPPEEYAAWLADRAAAARGALPGASGPVAPEVLDAGFTHRGAAGGAGFAAGGVLDRLPAGWLLAMAADRAWDQGLGELSDDEVAGLVCAARRDGSRQAALELAGISELSARRAGPDGIPGEHVEDEVAALLTLTGWAAARQVALADGLSRLPGVAAALAAGRIDADKAGVFAGELILVDDDLAAAAIAAPVVADAPGLTTSQIRRALRQEIALFDPQAAARRKDKARRDARVDVWIEPEGTGAIAGRGMDPAAAIAADQSLDADARWLQQQGAPGTLDQLRVQVLAARLTGQTLRSLLPEPPVGTGAAGAGTPNAAAGTGGGSGASGTGAGSAGAGVAGPGAGNGPVSAATPAAPGGWPAGLGGSASGPGALGGSVNLTMPLAGLARPVRRTRPSRPLWHPRRRHLPRPRHRAGPPSASAPGGASRWSTPAAGLWPTAAPAPGPDHRAATGPPGSRRSRSPPSRPGPAPTAANRPATGHQARCVTS